MKCVANKICLRKNRKNDLQGIVNCELITKKHQFLTYITIFTKT